MCSSSTQNTFTVGDHDFVSLVLFPVTLLADIPESVEGSWYLGQVLFGIKDAAFEPSSPLRHATELYNFLRKVDIILFIYSDGGPDHRLTYLSVQLSLIVLFLNID